MSPEHIKKAAPAPAEPERGARNITVNQIDTPQGEARAVDYSETEKTDTPNYIPPRCQHNVSKSALNCEQCSKRFREGELDE